MTMNLFLIVMAALFFFQVILFRMNLMYTIPSIIWPILLRVLYMYLWVDDLDVLNLSAKVSSSELSKNGLVRA